MSVKRETTVWRPTKLREVLSPVARGETVDASKEYRLLGVRLDGKGPFLRETIIGAQTCAAKLFRVASGDFIYSRLFACRGAFGVIGEALDGCYVSGEFPTFCAATGKIDVEFLRLWFCLPSIIERVNADCSGSTPLTRNRFKENFFLSLEIPLPPLAEQRRIVARIEELSAQIREAQELSRQAAAESEGLLAAMAHRADLDGSRKLRAGWRRTRLSEVISLVDDLHSVDASRKYPNLGIYSFGKGLFRKPPIEGAMTSAKKLRRVKTGQFIYSRLFAFEGAYGIVTSDFDGCFVSQEYPTFECVPNRVNAEFLASYFKPRSVWKDVATGSKGLGDRRQRVQPAHLLKHEFWLPPMACQNCLRDAYYELHRLRPEQGAVDDGLNALLPGILDRAFKGGL